MIVVDASTWVLALVDAGARGTAARDALATDLDWASPTQAPLEVLRTLRRYESHGTLTSDAASELAAEVLRAEVRYVGPDVGLLSYAWQHRHNFSPYDAPYVGLAGRHGIPLVTHDLRLARAAEALGVEVRTPGVSP